MQQYSPGPKAHVAHHSQINTHPYSDMMMARVLMTPLKLVANPWTSSAADALQSFHTLFKCRSDRVIGGHFDWAQRQANDHCLTVQPH